MMIMRPSTLDSVCIRQIALDVSSSTLLDISIDLVYYYRDEFELPDP